MPDSIKPNLRSKAEGIRDLSQSDNPINGHLEEGSHLITYCLNAPPSDEFLQAGVTSLHPIVNKYDLQTIRETFAELETYVNLKFKEVKDDTADIDIYLGFDMNENTGGYEGITQALLLQDNQTVTKQKRHIVMHPAKLYDFFAHELGHALGLSHPEHQSRMNDIISAIKDKNEKIKSGKLLGKEEPLPTLFYTGDSNAYDKDGTCMSYINGAIRDSGRHYGVYDIASLQQYYGEPGNSSPDKELHSNVPLPYVIYSKEPITLHIEPNSGMYRAELPSIYASGRVAFTWDSALAFDTYIANVIVSPATVTNKELVGNELQNKLQGGSGEDRLVSSFAGDTLTGGKGKDQFVLTTGSHDTIITDWSPDDMIIIPPESTSIVVKKHHSGTRLEIINNKNELICSALVPNTSSELMNAYVHHHHKYKVDVNTETTSKPKYLKDAVAAVAALDIGKDLGDKGTITDCNQPDGYIGTNELARIAKQGMNGTPWSPKDIEQHTLQFESIRSAVDLNSDGNVAHWEIDTVLNELASLKKFDYQAVKETLLSANLPAYCIKPTQHKR